MTTDELIVVRLQDLRICDIGLRRVAAKRIKQLTAERDRLREMVQASVSFMNGDLTAEEWNEVCMRPWQPPALKGEGHE